MKIDIKEDLRDSRDTVYERINQSQKNDFMYKWLIKKFQSILKGLSQQHNLSYTDTIIQVSLAIDNGNIGIMYMAAGYELLDGNDFTLIELERPNEST